MTNEELIRGIVGLQQLYEEQKGVCCYSNVFDYIDWLEVRLVSIILIDDKLQSQPSTTTPSDDVAAGHGAC